MHLIPIPLGRRQIATPWVLRAVVVLLAASAALAIVALATVLGP
jgi:hypothetical protein